MKTIKLIPLTTAILLPVATISAGEIVTEFQDVEKYTDFSVSGLSEKKTLSIFESELESELKRFSSKYLAEGQKLTITFTDIDMAGDIQPWRNRHNADIRYVESIYVPRLAFTYTLVDSDGSVITEGEESIADLAFQHNVVGPMKTQYANFFYEIDLLGDWIRKTFRQKKSDESGE